MADIRDTELIGSQNLEEQKKAAERLLNAILGSIEAIEGDSLEKVRVAEYFSVLGWTDPKEQEELFRALDYAVDNARTERLNAAALARSKDGSFNGFLESGKKWINDVKKLKYKQEIQELEYKVPSIRLINGFPNIDSSNGEVIRADMKLDMVKAALAYSANNFNNGLEEYQEQDRYGKFSYGATHYNPDGSMWCDIFELRNDFDQNGNVVGEKTEHTAGRIGLDKEGNIISCMFGSHGRHVQDYLVTMDTERITDVWKKWLVGKDSSETSDQLDDIVGRELKEESVIDSNTEYTNGREEDIPQVGGVDIEDGDIDAKKVSKEETIDDISKNTENIHDDAEIDVIDANDGYSSASHAEEASEIDGEIDTEPSVEDNIADVPDSENLLSDEKEDIKSQNPQGDLEEILDGTGAEQTDVADQTSVKDGMDTFEDFDSQEENTTEIDENSAIQDSEPVQTEYEDYSSKDTAQAEEYHDDAKTESESLDNNEVPVENVTPAEAEPVNAAEAETVHPVSDSETSDEERMAGAIVGGAAYVAGTQNEVEAASVHDTPTTNQSVETKASDPYGTSENSYYQTSGSHNAYTADRSGDSYSGSIMGGASYSNSEDFNRQQTQDALNRTSGYVDTTKVTAHETPSSGSYGNTSSYSNGSGASNDRMLTTSVIGKYGESDPETIIKVSKASEEVVRQSSGINHSGIADGYRALTKNNYALAMSALSSSRAASYGMNVMAGNMFGFSARNSILADSKDASTSGNVVGHMNSIITSMGGSALQPKNTKQVTVLREEYTKAVDKVFGYKGGAAIKHIAKGDLSVADIQHALNARGIKTTQNEASAMIRFAKREENQKRLEQNKLKSKTQLTKNLAKAAAKDSAVLDGVNELSKATAPIKKMYKAGAMVYRSYNVVVPYVATRFYNTKAGKPIKEMKDSWRAWNKSIDDKAKDAVKGVGKKIGDAAKDKWDNSRAGRRVADARTRSNERKERRLQRKLDRKAIRQARLDRFTNTRFGRFATRFGRGAGAFGRHFANVGRGFGKAGRGAWNIVTKGPFALLDWIGNSIKKLIKKLLMKIGMLVAPIVIPILMGAVIAFVVLTMITSFFEGAYTGDEELSIANSNMGQAWTIMERMEDAWYQGLGDLSGINTMYAFSTGNQSTLDELSDWFNDVSTRLSGMSGIQDAADTHLYYGRELMTASEYLNYEKYDGAPKLGDADENGIVHVTLASDNENMFVIDRYGLGEDYAKRVEYFDGGIYVDVQGADGSLKTSNIKEILCMAAVYFMDEDSPTGNTDAMDYGTWVAGATNHFKRGWNSFWFDKEELQTGATQSAQTIAQYAGEVFMDSHDVSYDLSVLYLPTIADPVYYKLKDTEIAGEIEATGLMAMIAGTGYQTVASSDTLKEISGNPWLMEAIGHDIITSGAVYNGNQTFMTGEFAASHNFYKNALNTQYDIAIVCPFGDVGGCTSLVPTEDPNVKLKWYFDENGEPALYAVMTEGSLKYFEAGTFTPTYYRSDFERVGDLLFGSTDERQQLAQAYLVGDGNYFPMYSYDDEGHAVAVTTEADGSATLCCLAKTPYDLKRLFTQDKAYRFAAEEVFDFDGSNAKIYPSGCWTVNGARYAPGDSFASPDTVEVKTESSGHDYDSASEASTAGRNAARGYFNGTSFSWFESENCMVDFGGMTGWGDGYMFSHPDGDYNNWTITIYKIEVSTDEDSHWVTDDDDDDTSDTTTDTDTEEESEPSGHFESSYSYEYKISSKTYNFSHDCSGAHSIRYCGGHMRVEARGYVCGFDDRWLTEDKQTAAEDENGDDRPVVAGIIEEGTFKYLANDANADVHGFDVAADLINTVTLGSNELAGLEAQFRSGLVIDPDWCLYKGIPKTTVDAWAANGAILVSGRDHWLVGGGVAGVGNYTDKILSQTGEKYVSNIFEKDAFVAHSVIMNGWENWTEDNITECLLKYQADWQEYYGIDISDYYAGQPVPKAIQDNVVDQLNFMRECAKNGTTTWYEAMRYAAIPDEEWEIRMEVVKECLRFAGSGTYSQAHHGHGFLGLDTNDKGEEYNCYATDCTGFGSFAERRSMHNCIGGFGGSITRENGSTMTDIYYNGNRLPIVESCNLGSQSHSGAGSTALPGDLVTLGSDRNTHVMVYIGSICPLWNCDYLLQSIDGGYSVGQTLNFEQSEDVLDLYSGGRYDKNDFEDLSEVNMSISWLENYHMPFIVHMTSDCHQEILASSQRWTDKVQLWAEGTISEALGNRSVNLNYGGVRFNTFGGSSSAWTEQCQVIHMPGYDLYANGGDWQGQGDYGVYNYIPE